MQRSRRTLLQRRKALEIIVLRRKRLYKLLSLALVLISWGLIFLLNSWMGRIDGYRYMGDAIASKPNGSFYAAVLLVLNMTTVDGSMQEDAFGGGDPIEAQVLESTLAEHLDMAVRNFSSDENFQLHSSNDGRIRLLEMEGTEHLVRAVDVRIEKVTQDLRYEPDQMAVDTQKGNGLFPIPDPDLEEPRSKAVVSEGRSGRDQLGSIIHRLEPGGKEYNYASESKGAKILDCNKEAKGASNILNKDKDKYLRNPCSSKQKFIVIQLSEETLVDTIEIGNFEHYSSNFKDFGLLSSLVYPTERWTYLGEFNAANVKHAQRFTLPEPKWARYLKINLLTHYGTEFYCTLSVVEVYGVDAIEKMLEELVPFQDDGRRLEEQPFDRTSGQGNTRMDAGEELSKLLHRLDSSSNLLGSSQEVMDFEYRLDIQKPELSKSNLHDSVAESIPRNGGRMPEDAVLKILMQKVRSLDLNFSVLERYIEELNSRYVNSFNHFDQDLSDKTLVMQHVVSSTRDLQESKEFIARDLDELKDWKASVGSQMNKLVVDNELLRLEMERRHNDLVNMENKGLVILLFSFMCGTLAIFKIFMGLLASFCRTNNSVHYCRLSSPWILMLFSTYVIFILVI